MLVPAVGVVLEPCGDSVHLFPARADEASVMAKDAAESRIWDWIHYPIDLEAGMELARGVAQKFID